MPITPVTHPRSAIAGKKPAADRLLHGQIAVGYAADDPTLWIRDTDDQVIRVTRKIATLAEAQAGTDNQTIITPYLLAQMLQDISGGGGACCCGVDAGDVNGEVWIIGGEALAIQPNDLDGGDAEAFTCSIDGGLAQ